MSPSEPSVVEYHGGTHQEGRIFVRESVREMHALLVERAAEGSDAPLLLTVMGTRLLREPGPYSWQGPQPREYWVTGEALIRPSWIGAVTTSMPGRVLPTTSPLESSR